MLTGGDPARKSAILGAAANFAGSAVPYNRDFPDDHAQVVVEQREWVGKVIRVLTDNILRSCGKPGRRARPSPIRWDLTVPANLNLRPTPSMAGSPRGSTPPI